MLRCPYLRGLGFSASLSDLRLKALTIVLFILLIAAKRRSVDCEVLLVGSVTALSMADGVLIFCGGAVMGRS